MKLRSFEIYRLAEYLVRLANGAPATMALTLGGAALDFALAVLLAVARHARLAVLAQTAATDVEAIRNTPPIVQFFIAAFGLPLLFA